MEILEIDKYLLTALHENARRSERLRMNRDMRTTAADGSQRMLNALEPGTRVPIHRHTETSETTICLEGCLDVIFYDMRPNDDAGGPMMGEQGNLLGLTECQSGRSEGRQNSSADGGLQGCGTAIVEGMEVNMFERCRIRLCPREGKFGVQIPVGAWHSVQVYEPSTIFEAKDGPYRP